MTATALEAERELIEGALLELLDWAGAQPEAQAPEFLGRQYDLGLAWVDNPTGEGGLGVDPDLQGLVDQRLLGRAPDFRYQLRAQWGLFGPALRRYGTSEQRRRWLRRLFTGEERWCVLLSEPNAGSDLASVATQARRDGDVWIVDGQKVWTSQAQASHRGLLLARHDSTIRGHAGLSAYIVDMAANGVEVRPLRQMTGDAEFNEVFLTHVAVPDADRVGAVGEGWPVVMLALTGERQVIADESAETESDPIHDVLRLWRDRSTHDVVVRDRIVRLWMESEVIRLYNNRIRQEGGAASGETLAKLAYTAYLQRAFELAVDLLGAEGMLYPDAYEFRVLEFLSFDGLDPRRNFLAARGRTIGGGTTQVLKNVVAERVLGLPREPRPNT